MNKKFEKEYILQTIIKTSEELNLNIYDQFQKEIAKHSKEIQDNPMSYAIIAAKIAEINSSIIMAEVLYKLLND